MELPKYRVVLDTNIIISSLWKGHPGEIVDYWQKGKIQVMVSQEILDECLSVIKRFNLSPEDLDDFLALFVDPVKTRFIKFTSPVNLVREDPGDNKFLACALGGKADFIISGDQHLLNLKEFRKIPIVNPKVFLSLGHC